MGRDGDTLPERELRQRLVRARHDPKGAEHDLILESLADERPRVRVLAVRAALHASLLSRERLDTLLADDTPEVRIEALHAINALGSDTDLIVNRFEDPDPLVVDTALFVVGELRVIDAIDQVMVIARTHEDARCRESAVAALGSLGDERGLGAVLDAMGDKAPVRRRAVVALSNFEGDLVTEALERALVDRDWQVRSAAAQLLDVEMDEG